MTEPVAYGVTVFAGLPDGRVAYRKCLILDGPLPLVLPNVVESMSRSFSREVPDRSTWHWEGSEVHSARD